MSWPNLRVLEMNLDTIFALCSPLLLLPCTSGGAFRVIKQCGVGPCAVRP